MTIIELTEILSLSQFDDVGDDCRFPTIDGDSHGVILFWFLSILSCQQFTKEHDDKKENRLDI